MTNKSYDFIMDALSNQNIKLSKTYKSIIDIMKDKNIDISDMDISEFSKSFYVSNSTVTRFAQKLGFDGFHELKYAINNDKDHYIYKSQSIYKKIIDSVEKLDQESVDFIKNIPSFKKILLIGIGSSGLVANEFAYKLNEFNLANVNYATEPYRIDLLCENLNDEDLLIAISNTGEHFNILKAIDIAKTKKAKILAISQDESSNLSKLSDIAIISPSYPSHTIKISKTISQLIIVDIICEILKTYI